MSLQTDSQPNILSNRNGCSNQGGDIDGEVLPETPIALYIGAPSESPSWRSLRTTTESSCSSASNKSSSTEWSRHLVSASSIPQVSSNDEPGWLFQSPKHPDFTFLGGFDGLTGDSGGHAYEYALGDRQYAPAYLLPSPNEIYGLESQDYSLSVPPELSSLCLDNQHTHSQPVTLPLRNFHLDPSTSLYSNHSETSFSSSGSLSPTSNGSFPFTTQMSASTSAPAPLRHSDVEGADFIPEPHSERKSRTSTNAKRNTSTQYDIPSSHHSESLVQRHPCTFPSCTLAFARARDLRRHFRLHSGELPYMCFGCGRGFIRSDARARHWRSQPECGARF